MWGFMLPQQEDNLKVTLTMHKVLYRGDTVAQYKVGTPATAFIRQMGNRYEDKWQILRVKPDDSLASPKGEYKCPEDALAALQIEFDSA